ncbi:MAG: hypothetical protein GX107_09340, partial [Clostridiales bacterium]|nr:hypothetical protein [Clostridiales bacterium]
MNEPEPSTLGFVVSDLSLDKAEGKAKVMVERVGGNQRPVTIKYNTVEGTALPGKDYESTESMLMFYAGVNKLPATVELIDDGLASDEPVYFDIVLSELLGDDKCTLINDQVRVNLINSGEMTELIDMPNLASQLYDPDLVDVSGSVTEAKGAANAGGSVISGRSVQLEQAETVKSDLVFGGEDHMSTQVYDQSFANIKFNNPASPWATYIDAANKDYWSASFNPGDGAGFAEAGGKAYWVGKDPNGGADVEINSGIALYSRREATAQLTDAGWQSMGGSSNVASQLFSSYDISIEARMGHDTSYLGGSTRYFSYTHPKLTFTYSGENGGSLVANPRYVKHIVLKDSGILDKNWAVRASDNNINFSNPFYGAYNGTINIGQGQLKLLMSLYYKGTGDHEQDTLNDASMIWLKKANLTRRTFARDAFKLEISTPNDSNTAPLNSTVITDYNNKFKPELVIPAAKGGVVSAADNRLYVGSTVKISTGTAPAGYYVSDLVVYQSRDGGNSWNKFEKFNISTNYEQNNEKYFTLKLVGKDSGPALDNNDMGAQYKFRIAYSRISKVTVDLSPSVPRMENSPDSIDTSRIGEALTGYTAGSNYGFSKGTGVGSNISYGYSTFNTNSGDFSRDAAEGSVPEPLDTGGLTGTEFSFTATNIQWVCFNLPADDLLLINGTAYPGNAKIYLKESDFAGGLSVLYYHKDYQTAKSAMKTAISWMALYWDANGNGMIDGYYNENDSTFVLTDVNGVEDLFWGYVKGESVNETMFAPMKNEDGNYCQFFIKACYTMTPRSLILPEGASDSERAQILPAFTTSVNPDSAAYSKLTPEGRAYRYIVSGLTRQSSTGTIATRSS